MSAADPATVIAELKRDCAVDRTRADARAAMADLLDYTVRMLAGQGFAPELHISCGMIELRFDPERIAMAGAAVPMPENEEKGLVTCSSETEAECR